MLDQVIKARQLRGYTERLSAYLSAPEHTPFPMLPWLLRGLKENLSELDPPQPSLRDTLSLPGGHGETSKQASQTDPKVSARLDTLGQARKDLLELRNQAAAFNLPEVAEIDQLLTQVNRLSTEQMQSGEKHIQSSIRERTEVMRNFLKELEAS